MSLKRFSPTTEKQPQLKQNDARISYASFYLISLNYKKEILKARISNILGKR
jgi:hypothetical protein